MLRHPIRVPIRPQGLPDAHWSVSGWLSVPAGPPTDSDTLLLLVHGACYTHAYWDFPYQPETYSFVQWAWEHGMATLNIDRLGNGESTHPPGILLTMQRNAEAVHQVIRTVKERGVAGRRFRRVAVVGHSLGSLTAALMQATYACADAVVLTGIAGVNVSGISNDPAFKAGYMQLVQHVSRDPVFQDRLDRYDADYFAMPPASRMQMFFRVPPCDPKLIEIDSQLAGTIAVGEINSFGDAADAAVKITVPVLVQMGQHDTFFHDPRIEPDIGEKYARAIATGPKNFTFAPLRPDTGHNLAQFPTAHRDYEVMASWLRDAS